MPFISENLAEWASKLTFDDIPPEVRRQAVHLILDGVGIAYASQKYEFGPKTVNALATFEPGHRGVIGFPQKLALRDAVVANGVLIHGLDFDDTHLKGVVHATSSCFPTALGVGSALGKAGRDAITAYVIGMETAARLGSVVQGELNQVGFHPTGVLAAFGCAMVAGKLEGLTAEQLVMAQGIALSMAAGTREYSTEGAWTKRMHPGWAGACGITAARLAQNGFTGPRQAYEGKFGLFATHMGSDLSKWNLPSTTDGLGKEWETLQVAIKPVPACQLNISCIDAAVALGRQHNLDPDDIESVEALIPPHAVKIVCEPIEAKRKPTSPYAAQFSIPFVVACGIIHKRFGLAELELFQDPAILKLAQRVNYSVDAKTGYPKHFSGEVIVTLKNGQKLAHREQINRGAADNPVSPEGIADKFMGNATMSQSQARAQQILDAVLGMDRLDRISSLEAVLAG